MLKHLSLPQWVKHYKRENVFGDFVAGLTVALILLPQSMAYAQISGLPPEMGWDASILPVLIYGFLGSSSVLSVGPTAVTAVVIFTTVNSMSLTSTTEYINATIVLVCISGLIQFLFGIFRLGFLGSLLTLPVLVGFLNAASIVVGMSQLGSLLGTQPMTSYVIEPLIYTVNNLHKISINTLIITIICLSVLQLFRIYLPKLLRRFSFYPIFASTILPLLAPIVVVTISGLVVLFWKLDVTIVSIENINLTVFSVPEFEFSLWGSLIPGALLLAIISFVESISVSKSLAIRNHHNSVNPNQELLSVGLANIASAFSGGMSVSGSLSRSVVNEENGAKTGLSSIITAGFMLLFLLVLGPLLHFIPQAALSSIILLAVGAMFDIKVFWTMWSDSRINWLIMVATFLTILILGIERGIVIGITLSFVAYLWQNTQRYFSLIFR